MLNVLKLVFFICFVFDSFVFGQYENEEKHSLELEASDKCSVFDREGSCKLITECPEVFDMVRSNGAHDYPRCGFEGVTEIVCCPEAITGGGGERIQIDDNPSSQLRKALRECAKHNQTAPSVRNNIIGGEEADFGEFPHMAAVGYSEPSGSLEFKCGGSLISPTFVLTAAHCISERSEPKFVRLGVTEVERENVKRDPSKDYDIEWSRNHPSYQRKYKYNDIGLLKLSRTVELKYWMKPACLFVNKEDPRGDLAITGWGQTSINRSDQSKFLLKANVSAISIERCNDSYTVIASKMPQGVVESQLCAGNKGLTNSDACQGDSGGPIQQQNEDGDWWIVGIISFGRGCGSDIPAIYTRVYSFLDWIEETVWPDNF